MWHHRETLAKVASKQDAFAAEWEVVCMHEVSEQAVKAVKLELVGHGAFIPDYERCVSDSFCFLS